MTTLPQLSGQVTGNAANGQFSYGFALEPVSNTYYVAHVSLNTAFTPIDPATEETVAAGAASLASIDSTTKTGFKNSGACTLIQTVIALTAGETYTHPGNANRKSLRWMVTGPGAIAVAPGIVAPPNALSGVVYDGAVSPSTGAPASGWQGSVQDYDGPSIPVNAFTMIAIDQATNVVIWEGT